MQWKSINKLTLIIILLSQGLFAQSAATEKPFTRWWWMGSAVSKAGIKYNLQEFQKAGIGGVEITPIYGVKGTESSFLPFLSPEYLDALNYTCHIADSLGLKVDMVLGTGWPYGGPQVEPGYAASKLAIDSILVTTGQKIIKPTANALSPHAEFLDALFYGSDGTYTPLTSQVSNGALNYTPTKDGVIYLLYSGKTGQKVKRAAPGGEGYTLDHYSKTALQDYVKPYNEVLKAPIRAIFNDSYEVYGTDFTPKFFEAFQEKRGYDLKPYLPLLVNKINSKEANRIRSDYRETLGDLLQNDFDKPWTDWAHSKGYQTKLQAHGSPGNLLDLYATADIPECETFGSMPFDIPGLRREADDIRVGDADPVMLKFSTSAGHVMGKPLISSESFTWLRDHFKVALSQTKPELEELLLNGVNHTFLHGSTYSPPEAAWPGWKFYASVNFSPQMTIWKDAPALFAYIKNCQHLLQSGQPDNEIGLYWPIYDVWAEYLKGDLFFQFKIHSLEEWLLGTPFYAMSNQLMKAGYGVDFLSDEFIETAVYDQGMVKFKGGSYKAIVIPKTVHMPIATLQKLLKLKNQGAQILFENQPETVPGFDQYAQREVLLNSLSKTISPTPNILLTLQEKGISPEAMVQTGLKFIRRKTSTGEIYFLVNHMSKDFEGYLPINASSEKMVLFDPDTEQSGRAIVKNENGQLYIKLQLKAGKSIFVKTNNEETLAIWKYTTPDGGQTELHGKYILKFLDGGPTIPKSQEIEALNSWTSLGEEEANFSGTAEYFTVFKRPKGKADAYIMTLPDVRESARVWVNGEYQGTLWSNPFELKIDHLKRRKNALRIEVTNLSANRIRAKELASEEWKIFYEINMVNKDYQKFDATLWKPMPSGMIGTIKIQPINYDFDQ